MCDCLSIGVSIAALVVSVISAIIYFYTLREQRKQNALLLQQYFYEQWQELIRQQLKICDEMHVVVDVLNNDKPDKMLVHGNTSLVRIWIIFLRLQKAIADNNDYSNWELMEADYENAIHNIPEELEYCDIKRYNETFEDLGETRKVAFVGHVFGVKKQDTKPKNPQQSAFSLIYERYFKGTSTYFTHLCSMLRFLERNQAAYKSQIDECAQILKDNMSAYELGVVEQYANFDKFNSVILRKYLFTID